MQEGVGRMHLPTRSSLLKFAKPRGMRQVPRGTLLLRRRYVGSTGFAKVYVLLCAIRTARAGAR